jgi:hypothetical protein
MNIVRPTRGRAEILGFGSAQLAGEKYCAIGNVFESQDSLRLP